jgi:hypothetical protein
VPIHVWLWKVVDRRHLASGYPTILVLANHDLNQHSKAHVSDPKLNLLNCWLQKVLAKHLRQWMALATMVSTLTSQVNLNPVRRIHDLCLCLCPLLEPVAGLLVACCLQATYSVSL